MAMWAEGTFRSVMLPGHEDAVCSLAFRGSLLASGSRDCTARLWTVRDTSGAPEALLKHVLAHPNLVTCVALNSEASVLSSGCYDQQIRLWSTESGECTCVLTGHSGTVWAAQWSAATRSSQRRCSLPRIRPHPRHLPVGGRAGPLLLSGAGYPECCVSLWDTEQGTRLASSSGHTKAVRALAVGQGALQGVLVRCAHAYCMGTARALHRRCKQCWCTSTFLPATRPVCAPTRHAAAPPPRPCCASTSPSPRHRHASGGAGERLLYLPIGPYILTHAGEWLLRPERTPVGQRDLALRGHKAGPRARGLHPRCNPVQPNAPHAASPMPATPRHLSPPHAAAPGLPCRTPHASHAYPPVAGRSSAWRPAARGSRAAAWAARSASGTAAPRAAPPRSPTAAAATSGVSPCWASITSSRAAGTAPCASGTCAARPQGTRRPRVAALLRRARRAAWSPACRPSRAGSSTRRAAARWLSTTRAAGAWQAAGRAYVCGSCRRNNCVPNLNTQLSVHSFLLFMQ